MKVFVVMGNDFPSAVFSTEKLAVKFMKTQQEDPSEKKHKAHFGHPRIHWRCYDFELDRSKP